MHKICRAACRVERVSSLHRMPARCRRCTECFAQVCGLGLSLHLALIDDGVLLRMQRLEGPGLVWPRCCSHETMAMHLPSSFLSIFKSSPYSRSPDLLQMLQACCAPVSNTPDAPNAPRPILFVWTFLWAFFYGSTQYGHFNALLRRQYRHLHLDKVTAAHSVLRTCAFAPDPPLILRRL